jgi:hypothetical protein
MTTPWDTKTLPSEVTKSSFPDLWTTMSWGFDLTLGRVTFTGNVLATSHTVSREPNFSLMSLKGLVPIYLYFRVKDQLISLSILDSTFDREFSLCVGM